MGEMPQYPDRAQTYNGHITTLMLRPGRRVHSHEFPQSRTRELAGLARLHCGSRSGAAWATRDGRVNLCAGSE
jgi:hypothetical protein